MTREAQEMRAKLRAHIAEQDAARGRPLTDAERIANLRHAIARVCAECGHEVEPMAKCGRCGAVNDIPACF